MSIQQLFNLRAQFLIRFADAVQICFALFRIFYCERFGENDLIAL
jgi:hypothetical protein